MDCFFSVNSIPIHVASAGGFIPDFVNNRENLQKIQKIVHNLPIIYQEKDLIFNRTFIDQYVNDMRDAFPEEKDKDINWEHEYTKSFVEFGIRGFVSIDKTKIYDYDDFNYHFVCRPPSLNHNIFENIKLPILDNHIDINTIIGDESFSLLDIMKVTL